MSLEWPERGRRLSVILFGQRYRLELMAHIAESVDGIVCLKDLAEELDVSVSNLQKPLRDLLDGGLLTPLPSGDSRRRYYQRVPSHGWAFAVELASRIRDLSKVDATNE